MNILRKNMFWTYTILALICGILALVFGVLATYADRTENSPTKPITTTFNIKGDYINRDKNINEKPILKKDKAKKTKIKNEHQNNETKSVSTINNGIINSGVNYGNQTVNNYGTEPEPRKLNKEDINTISTIPEDFKVSFLFVNSTEESFKYAEQVFSVIKKLGYNIIDVNSVGMYIESGGKPHSKDERIYLTLDSTQKVARVIIREQK